MYWVHLTSRSKQRPRAFSPAEQDPFADQSASLHWTALMIIGSEESAVRTIVDATRLAETKRAAFRDWLVLWAHLATARNALDDVRSSIQKTARQYADWSCSHGSHEPLSKAEVRTLQRLDTKEVIKQLDVLARAILLLRGCHGASFEDCVFLLQVPLQSAVGAYCTALQWFKAFTEPADATKHTQHPRFFSLLRPKWTIGV